MTILGFYLRVIRIAPQPQYPGSDGMRCNPVINLISIRRGLRHGVSGWPQRQIDMLLRKHILSEIAEPAANKSMAAEFGHWVRQWVGNGAELPGVGQFLTIVSGIACDAKQYPKYPKLLNFIADFPGYTPRLEKVIVYGWIGPIRIVKRPGYSYAKLHFGAKRRIRDRFGVRGRGDMRQGEFEILPMFSEERKLKKDWRGRRRQIETKCNVASAHKRPIQGSADVNHRLTKGLFIVDFAGRLATFEKSLRMTPSQRTSLAAFLQSVLAIRPSGIEQAIAGGPLIRSCDHQRFVEKTCQPVVGLVGVDQGTHHKDGILQCEAAVKYR